MRNSVRYYESWKRFEQGMGHDNINGIYRINYKYLYEVLFDCLIAETNLTQLLTTLYNYIIRHIGAYMVKFSTVCERNTETFRRP